MSRPETGPMKFGDDWTGVFIRGDEALMGYAPALERALVALEALWQGDSMMHDVIAYARLKGLCSTSVLMRSAEEGASDQLQHLPSWGFCND